MNIGDVVVPLVTPLDGRGAVSAGCVERLVESVRPRATALLPALTSGEGWRLSLRQWTDVVRATVRCAGGLPVVAGVELATAAEVAARADLAMALGADAVAVAPPFRPGAPPSAALDHYQAVRAATAAPILVYNESTLSGVEVTVDVLCRICRLPGVVGVKESSGSLDVTGELVAARPGVPVLQGFEHLLPHSKEVDGCVVSLSNLEPALCADAVGTTSPAVAAALADAVARFGLEDPDWYAGIKRELVRRGVIRTADLVHEDQEDRS